MPLPADTCLALEVDISAFLDLSIDLPGGMSLQAQLKPGDSTAQAHLGNALCAKGAIQEGLAQLSKAVDLDPANTAIRYNLASTLARLKQYDRAIPHLRQILRLDPGNTNALVSLAASYAQTNQADKALACLEEALQIAKAAGNQKLVEQIARQIQLYLQRPPTNNTGR